jgi:hypothetical protein
MVTTTIEKSVDNENYVETRRLVEGPEKVKACFFSKLAGSWLTRWAERYAEYLLETRYRDEVRAADNSN